MMERIKQTIQESIDVKRQLLNSAVIPTLQEMSLTILEGLQSGGRLFICGNGGSAADAQHIAAELSVRFKKERSGIPAIALGTNFSHTTAAGNDYGFDFIYSRQINGLAQKGDFLIAISTSGNSENILQAIAEGKKKGMTIFGWTGKTGGKMAGLTDAMINIPSEDTARIQECHILCGHILCELIEEKWD